MITNIATTNYFLFFLLIIRNELYPGLNRDYSILELADNIKNLNNNGTFQYMLDANSRRHWGGIFEAPTSYRLISSSKGFCTYFFCYVL